MVTENSEQAGANGSAKTARRGTIFAANALILTLSICFSLLIAEAAYRVAVGVSLADATNWRNVGVRTKRVGERATYDTTLGWTLKDDFRSPRFNTIAHGVRRNFNETALRTGSILAVGDSFTEGFDEVDDAGTWPAHLEKITGLPVINGGVAGYATDQILLRAEQLLPVVKPKTLIIGFTEVDIGRTGLSEAGAPKPYFTVENGNPVYHPPAPLEPKRRENASQSLFRNVLSYSVLADQLLSRLTPAFWYPNEASVYKWVQTDPFAVTCKLLERVKRQADENGVRVLLFLQYAGDLVLEEPEAIEDMRYLGDCAQKVQIQVVDHFAPLKAVTQGKAELVAQYYAVQGNEFGHMSSKGNEHAAQVLAKALQETKPVPAASPSDPATDKPQPQVLPN
jgi:hypothetical protein